MCQICGDNVGKTVDGEPFVACDVCAFPVCRPCYEYERKDGNQSCPQCKTRYKRHKGLLLFTHVMYQFDNCYECFKITDMNPETVLLDTALQVDRIS